MREIQCLTRFQVGFHSRPNSHHSGIREQAHDDSTLLTSLLDAEQRLARYPTISNRLLESLALTLANDHVETIIAQVQALTRTLYAITNHCDCLVFQNLSCFLQRKLFTGHHILDNTAKIHLCHFFVTKLVF